MVEKGLFTIEKEVQCLKKILLSIGNKAVLYYKPHPNDSKEKLEYYKNNFKQLKIYNRIEPAELLFTSNSKLKAVISYQSSALMNVDKFAKTNIKAISLADSLNVDIHPVYRNIMEKSGIIFY